MTHAEHEAYRITGHDGKRHLVWSRSDQDAARQATRWGRRHGGVASLEHLTLQPGDGAEGCWDRAAARPVAL